MTPTEFAAACRETSRNMRRLPAEVRRDLRSRVKDEVAERIAADVRSSGSSVYARRAAATTRVRAGADPTIVVGGAKRVVSGGGRGREIVFGAHWGGGGKRVTAVPARPGRRGYRRRSTAQFAGQGDPFVYGTIGRHLDRYLELWADIIDDVVERVIGRG